MRWLTWIGAGLLTLVAILAAALMIVDTDVGHRFVAERIAGIRTNNGLRFSVGRIDGSLYSDTRLVDLKVYDLDGLVFQAPDVALDWHPLQWLSNRLAIDRLAVPSATLFHTPHTRKSAKRGPILPDFDIRIGSLSVRRLIAGEAGAGTGAGRAAGGASGHPRGPGDGDDRWRRRRQ